jgi:aryl-alcohol dehydrogenase-like predicted oxidoreductase
MLFRTLGSTGLNVSVIGVGTWQFGGEWGRDYTQPEADAIFDAAREAGINLIDTAECYGDHTSERLIGGAIERDRDKWIVATKFGHKFNANFQRTEPRSPADVLKQCEDSLKALRTDYIDLYQYHSWGDTQFFAEDVHAALLVLKDEGKIRHLGNSVAASTRTTTQIEASQKMQIEAIQIVYNRLERWPEERALGVCLEQKLGVLARVPLASGYLSGKYKPGHQFPAGEVRSTMHNAQDRDAKLREAERIGQEEVPAGVSMAQWALAWCLKSPAVTCVIPGCKDADQVRANAEAVRLVDKM